MQIKRILLVCYATQEVGLGHLSRLISLSLELKKTKSIQIEFLIVSSFLEKKELKNFKHEILSNGSYLTTIIEKKLAETFFDLVVYDFHKSLTIDNLGDHLLNLRKSKTNIIAIDCLCRPTRFCV